MGIINTLLMTIEENKCKTIIVEDGSINRVVTNIETSSDSEGSIISIILTLDGYLTKVVLYSEDINDYYIIDNQLIISI